ncbi:TonB-dependent receptor [Mucilaginibacter paludis]|uniref:TonB-dependent receptor plug n=1 Tax=Mucilaginibacter paludis DSM 18603 TaxID=714943 RepID=H1YGN4_9SPHI|nr:carboxypeptidase-like regulatory domain-containing protein [Mucilaginibacter paludis]EHQ25420.1 TonB-dependent receptor plug [Mucilaginibacter paludis DSM 18603]
MRIILLFFLALLFNGAQLFAQSRIMGKILDSKTKESLIGATVMVKGTTIAASAALDGSFKITIPAPGTGVLVFTYIGYVSKEITVSETKSIGTVYLEANSSSLGEVTVTSDVAIDRKTPIAVTTINSQFIEENLGNQDLPELLSGTPSVQVTQQGGGYGDSRINIRGFKSGSKNGNVALTINGIPVNDMENGSIFWSNWSGLGDVTSSMQIQRGLGASKIVVPSFGGTINITTRNTDIEKGGSIQQIIGSDGFSKTVFSVSSGLNKNGWAATFSGGKTIGNGNADGLQFNVYSYFANITKVFNKNHSLSLNFMGANQTHGQRYNLPIDTFRNAPQGTRYNGNWGIKDGQIVNPVTNNYSKPLASLTHHWTLNETSDISTILYATSGSGGTGAYVGTRYKISNQYSPLDLTAAEKANMSSADGSALNYIRTSRNDHYWAGIRSTYNKNFSSGVNLSAGVDGRYYEGIHYYQVADLLGASYVLDKFTSNPSAAAAGSASGDINNPNHQAKVGDKIGFYNKDAVISGGGFTQVEYSKNDLSVFGTLSANGTGYQRKDFYNYLNTDPRQSSPYVKFFTFQAKTGANYNIDNQSNIFANIGYITKPPYYDNVFLRFTNTINTSNINEALFSYELGYGYKSRLFSANVNLYRSMYMNEAYTNSVLISNALYSASVSGVNEMHQGVEIEVKSKPVKGVYLNAMLSVGDWYYTKNAGPAVVYNDQQQAVSSLAEVQIKGLKVGDASQTTASVNLQVDVVPELKIGATYNYNGNYTSTFLFTNATKPDLHPYKVPSYSLVGMNAVFRFKFAGLDGSLIGTVTNLFNTVYLSDAFDSTLTGSVGSPTTVYYGIYRTFTTGVKIKF